MATAKGLASAGVRWPGVKGLGSDADGPVTQAGAVHRHLDLPGVRPGSVDVDVEDRTLAIPAERSQDLTDDVQWLSHERPPGAFARHVALGYGALGRGRRALLDGGNRFVVNVHTPDEGGIDATDVDIPFDRLEERAAELPQDRKSAIAVYCMTGGMSETAVNTLAGMG